MCRLSGEGSTRKPDGAAEHLWVTQPVNVSLKEKENQKLIRMAVVITHQRELGSSYDGCKLLVTPRSESKTTQILNLSQ